MKAGMPYHHATHHVIHHNTAANQMLLNRGHATHCTDSHSRTVCTTLDNTTTCRVESIPWSELNGAQRVELVGVIFFASVVAAVIAWVIASVVREWRR